MADLSTVLGGTFHAGRHRKNYSASKPTDIDQSVLDAMRASGLPGMPRDIVANGEYHRFSSGERGHDKNGWYVVFDDGIHVPAGAFGCWRTGLSQKWCAKEDNQLTPLERETTRKHYAAMEVKKATARLADNEAAAIKAKSILDAAQWATPDAPYLAAKGVQPHSIKVADDGTLLVAMRDIEGVAHNVERINPNDFKDKRGLSGGRRDGLFFAIGPIHGAEVVVICEGFATGASIHEVTGYPVACAFNAGNVGKVATALRDKYPDVTLVMAADDDWKNDVNAGMVAARKAAKAVNGLVAVPVFDAATRGDKDTDFNDLVRLSGAGAVKACFDNAQKPLPKVKAGSPCAEAFFESAINLVAYTPTPTMANDQFLTWSEPTPLPTALPMVKAFDAQLLPEALRPWVMDIANRMQCPVDFPAVAALVALSGLIGARAVVQPKQHDDWQVVPVLWGMAIGRPGVKKSPSINEALKPLDKLQVEISKQNKAEFDSWTMDARIEAMMAEANEKKAKALISKDPAAARALLEDMAAGSAAQENPPARRLTVNDATVEKLGEIMKENPWGLMAYRDELHGLLTSLDKQGQEGSRAFYLQAYDGDKGYTFDRIGRGTVYVPRVCLAMIGGIQPGKLQAYVRDAVSEGCADDGLLQRFSLAVWPDINPEYRYIDQRPDYEARQTAYAVFERLAALQPLNDLEPVVWRFDKAAQAIYAEWDAEANLENRADDMHPAMVSHLSKYAKLIPALALVFAMIDTPDGNVIHETELVRALAFGEYLKSHATRIYQAAVTPETASAAVLLQKIKEQRLDDGFTVREVVKKGWTGLNTPEAVRRAAAVLTSFDWLYCEVVQSPKGSRPSEQYRINPVALKAEKAA